MNSCQSTTRTSLNFVLYIFVSRNRTDLKAEKNTKEAKNEPKVFESKQEQNSRKSSRKLLWKIYSSKKTERVESIR